ncbi:MAG: antibiotic biosynthesis monooxygenase family protein [Myxococcota bacterium]
MAEKMILSFPVHPEKRDDFVALLNNILPDTRAFEGCIAVQTWLPEHDPGQVWIYEEWETRDHQGAYMTWRMTTGMGDAIGPFVTGAPQVMWIKEG